MDIEQIQLHPKPHNQAGILLPAQASGDASLHLAASFQPAAALASQRLAESVLRRYGVVPSAGVGLEPVHLQPPAGQVLLQTTRRYSLHLAPHIRLAFAFEASGSTPSAAETQPRPALEFQHPERLPDRPTGRQRMVETLVERLFARGDRIPSVPAAEPAPNKATAASGTAAALATLTGRAPGHEPQPVQRVLRKPAPALAPDTARTVTESPGAVQVTGAQTARPALSPSTAPVPIDIQQITQQVIQTIDRKIIGQRERFGRI